MLPPLAGRAQVRIQLPFAASDDSEPAPDLAVVGPEAPSWNEHSSTASLIIEVADASRRRDLQLKAALYASSAVDEYWVVDLAAREVVVHRGSDGRRWGHVEAVPHDATLSPQAFPDVVVRVTDILPPA